MAFEDRGDLMTVTRRWQLGLILFGLALLALGIVVLVQEVNPKRYIGILTWLAGAIIIHDGIIAPTVFGSSLLMRKYGARVPSAVIAIVQGALVVGGIVTIIVVPEVLKKSIGTLSTSILPQNYLLNLVLFYGALVIITGLVIAGYLRRFTRRAKLRSSSVHD
jgi:hypothetical protein